MTRLCTQIYLQDHSRDDQALSVIPASHRVRGCAPPCGTKGRGYVEAPQHADRWAEQWATSGTPVGHQWAEQWAEPLRPYWIALALARWMFNALSHGLPKLPGQAGGKVQQPSTPPESAAYQKHFSFLLAESERRTTQ